MPLTHSVTEPNVSLKPGHHSPAGFRLLLGREASQGASSVYLHISTTAKRCWTSFNQTAKSIINVDGPLQRHSNVMFAKQIRLYFALCSSIQSNANNVSRMARSEQDLRLVDSGLVEPASTLLLLTPVPKVLWFIKYLSSNFRSLQKHRILRLDLEYSWENLHIVFS